MSSLAPGKRHNRKRGDDSPLPLTPLECETLRMLALGATPKEIAFQRGRSRSTIKNQLVDIRAKLTATTSIHAVYLAVKQGLIP